MSYILKGPDDSPILHDGKEVHASDLTNVIKAVNMKSRTLDIIGSDETRDRHGDIIRVAGWMLENYLNNPVFLWSHGAWNPPLAAASRVIRRRSPRPHLEFSGIRFPTIGLNPFADMILSLYSEKILNASSVGFIPYKWNELPKDEDAPPRYYPGREFIKQELLELSACSVPANPSALQNSTGFKSLAQAHEIPFELALAFLSGEKVDMKDLVKADIQEELYQIKCEFEDELDSKVHQVPTDIDPEILEVETDVQGVSYQIPSEDTEELSSEDVLKPYPNEHSCRLKDPAGFDKFRRGKREHDGKTYSVIYGRKKDSDKWAEQAYRYNKETWKASEARKHCSSHGGSFEAASDSDLVDFNVKFSCRAEEQFDSLEEGQVCLNGTFSGEAGLVIDSISWIVTDPDEIEKMEVERFVRESVGMPDDCDTRIQYHQMRNGRLVLVKLEFVNLEKLRYSQEVAAAVTALEEYEAVLTDKDKEWIAQTIKEAVQSLSESGSTAAKTETITPSGTEAGDQQLADLLQGIKTLKELSISLKELIRR